MRVYTKIGDVFKLSLSDSKTVFFQYIAKDSNCMNTDVIRVFNKLYSSDDTPEINRIISNDVCHYFHTFVSHGLKIKCWEKIGASKLIGEMDVCFKVERDNISARLFGGKWFIWVLNGWHGSANILPDEFIEAERGCVLPPLELKSHLQKVFQRYSYKED